MPTQGQQKVRSPIKQSEAEVERALDYVAHLDPGVGLDTDQSVALAQVHAELAKAQALLALAAAVRGVRGAIVETR